MSGRKHPVAGYVFDRKGTVVRNFSLSEPPALALAGMIDLIDIGKELGREPRIEGKDGLKLSYLGPVNNDNALYIFSTDSTMTYRKFERFVGWMKFLYSR